MVAGKTVDTRLFAINHIGGHRHIMNAWRTLDYMNFSNLIDVNENKDYVAMEFFRFGPLGVSEDEIESEFIFPLNKVGAIANMFS